VLCPIDDLPLHSGICRTIQNWRVSSPCLLDATSKGLAFLDFFYLFFRLSVQLSRSLLNTLILQGSVHYLYPAFKASGFTVPTGLLLPTNYSHSTHCLLGCHSLILLVCSQYHHFDHVYPGEPTSTLSNNATITTTQHGLPPSPTSTIPLRTMR
jgi:hypothetical protein